MAAVASGSGGCCLRHRGRRALIAAGSAGAGEAGDAGVNDAEADAEQRAGVTALRSAHPFYSGRLQARGNGWRDARVPARMVIAEHEQVRGGDMDAIRSL